jgi:UPF0716 family protein affecting phage T7 exclusion
MFALAKLWQSALGSLGWLLLCGVLSAVLGALLLRRQLRPLDYMVAQSHAIARASSSACRSCRARLSCAAWCRR